MSWIYSASRRTLSNSLIPQTFTKIGESVKKINKAYALCVLLQTVGRPLIMKTL